MSDIINKASHYNNGKIECIAALKEWLSEEQYRGFLKGNVIKYLCREGHKDSRKQDCKKAQYYLNKLVESFAHDEDTDTETDDNEDEISCCERDCAHYDDDEYCLENCYCAHSAEEAEYFTLPWSYVKRHDE